MAKTQDLLTKEEALKLLKFKDEIGNNTKISEFNQKISDFVTKTRKKLDLRSVDLTGADLREANLKFVMLNNTVMRGADLRGAILPGIQYFTGVDFKNAKYSIGENGTKFPEGFSLAEQQMTSVEPAPFEELRTTDYAIAGVENKVDDKKAEISGVDAPEHPDSELGVSSITVGAPLVNRRVK